jgi:hypothetical protein
MAVIQPHGGVFNVRREVRPVAQVPPAPDHGQVNAGAPALDAHGQHVHVFVGHVVHRLLVQHFRQGRHLVAHLGRLLKGQRLGVGHHAGLHLGQHLGGVAIQERGGAVHVFGIGGRAQHAHAGA